MGRTPLISFWSISHPRSFPEIIPPLCLSPALPAIAHVRSSAHLNTYKQPPALWKMLLEPTNNGNVILDSFRFTFCFSFLVHLVWSVWCYTQHCATSFSAGQLKIWILKSVSGIQPRCSHCVPESSHQALQPSCSILSFYCTANKMVSWTTLKQILSVEKEVATKIKCSNVPFMLLSNYN